MNNNYEVEIKYLKAGETTQRTYKTIGQLEDSPYQLVDIALENLWNDVYGDYTIDQIIVTAAGKHYCTIKYEN